MATVQILSGMGCKGPACIRVETGEKRWLLDCGFGPELDAPFDPAWLDGVDAVFISHDHIDHIGGADHVVAAGLPIYATAQTAKSLPQGADVTLLRARQVIDGVPIVTGRNGHAMGGVWMHLGLGQGLFYSGDWSEESQWFPFDQPPMAATAILDCSYGLTRVSQEECLGAIFDLVARCPGQILFPVPPSGRAGELALLLMRRFPSEALYLDATCKAAVAQALAEAGAPELRKELRDALQYVDAQQARFLICDTPNLEAGEARAIWLEWQKSGRLGRDAHVVFTGHVIEDAKAVRDGPGGHFCRWNVHPPLQDQLALLHHLGAARFAPAFCPDPTAYAALPDLRAGLFFKESITL